MAYSASLYRKAKRILEARRDKAYNEAQERSEEIRKLCPEVDSIQKQLLGVGIEISQLFFFKGNTDEKVAELKEKSNRLIAKRAQILKENGFDENAMQTRYICPVCEDSGFVCGRMCKCHTELLKELMRKEVRRFAPLEDFTFDNFSLERYSNVPLENSIVPRERAQKIFDSARLYAQNFSLNSKNLLFLGATGLGKTHLSVAIANVVINKGFYVCYGTSQNICDDLQSEQFGRTENIYYTKQQVLDCDLLILDDLGCEIENQYTLAILLNIINTRILSKKPTIISTNYELSQLLEKYDQRITSRITGEYTKMTFFGSDIRNQ
ncbi:MAG: ATP-binding protein [Eubacterium sp.]|nr:ATP-binding protein [Eubacterium sp.]MBR7061339.1 ATP-binding protein [Eubacterium sp.]